MSEVIVSRFQSLAIRRFAVVFTGATPRRDDPANWDGGTIPWINSGAVNQRRIVRHSSLITKRGFQSSSTKWIPAGSVVIAMAGQGKTKGMAATVERPMTGNQSLAALIVNRRIMDYRYLAFALEPEYRNLRGVVGNEERSGLSLQDIRSFKIPVPSLEEQGLIVRYLDHAELRIAKAIAAKQDVVRLLREQKAVVASTALFGSGWKTGVDKWFGEVPVEWEVLPSRALFAERIERDRGDLEMLSVTIARGVIKQSSYLKSDGSKKDQAREDRSQYKVVEQDDLVYNKMRAWQGAAGKSDFQGIVSPAYVVLRPFSGANSDYYGMVLRSRQFAREAERYSYGITSDMWSLRPQHFKIIEFPCPPLSEQATIVDRCRTQTKKIDLAIEAIETEILLLKEYRTRLISDVVTGKLDVREEASKLPGIDPMVLATVAVGENGDDEEASDDD